MNLIFSYRQQLCVIYLFYTDDLIDKPVEKNWWAMSVAIPVGWGVRLAHPQPCGHLQAWYHTLTGRRDATVLHTNIATLTADWPRMTAPGRKSGGRQKFSVCPSRCERVGESTTFFLQRLPNPPHQNTFTPKHPWPYRTRVTVH